ncbi:ORF6N domain-containing protein [uncultured Thiodictyon sp.]|uniref:ORF6N domain-containing protein n=1 Tax=uncultured Thiodictyon sp. TaxID=1846217 RepID=UPI0025EB2910|nr:ORF6N domain-containing protein [uncultured Thiodictyon sp.]
MSDPSQDPSVPVVSPDTLPVVAYQGVRVVTTELLAQLYGASEQQIRQNFANNQARFESEKHFVRLEGVALQEFKNYIENFDVVKISPKTRHLILWTERGAARHAKMLDTDRAWEVFEQLEDAYFRRADQAAAAPVPSPATVPGTDPEHPAITLGDIAIRQDRDGRYCINDVYQAAGGDDQHQPNRWLQRHHTIAIIKECEVPGCAAVVATPGRGTFVVKKVLLAYGLSVSLAFHLRVSRAFEAATTAATSQPADGPLLPSEQQALAAVIGARCEGRDGTTQEQVSAGLWASLQRQFHIVEPAELPRSKLAEAIVYLTALPVTPAPVPALPAPAAEVLTRADRANLDRLLGIMTDHLFHARAWRFAIWRSLRAVTGTRSPQQFEVRHLPVMCAELRRLYAASAAWEDAVYEAEADLLRRVFRLGEDFEQVIAELRAEQLAAGVERGAQLIVELSHGRMGEISKLYARVPGARRDPRPDLQE